MPKTYNVGDFFLYRTSSGEARYLGVIIQKNPPVHENEPRLLLLSGVKIDIQSNSYPFVLSSLNTQDRLIRYVNEMRNSNSDQEFDRKHFSVVYTGLGQLTPFCGRLSLKQLTPIKNLSALQDALNELKPRMFSGNPEHIIRFFQQIHRPFNTVFKPNLSL